MSVYTFLEVDKVILYVIREYDVRIYLLGSITCTLLKSMTSEKTFIEPNTSDITFKKLMTSIYS